MNEERENGRFDPADFIPADAQPKVAVSCELEEPPRGSALTGILGALFGALVGAVPWFLTSTFADFFVGWLGFLVGVAACWGYRLFKGRRSTRFAMATVIVCSLLALFAAEIASWMYVLCSNPEWQADAAWYGIPVAQLAWESILMPENWGIMAPSMLMGMVSWALTICIFVIVYGRMIEIYLVTSIAPIPMATMMNREWGQMGQNYLRSLFAPVAGELIYLCENGALNALMTGSGSAVFGIFSEKSLAENAANRMPEAFGACFLAEPVNG